jgi:hypothetical protein
MKKNALSTRSTYPIALLFSALSVSFTACRTAEIPVREELKNNATPLAVKGRQGFQIGQVLSFGEYHTSKVDRGWTRSYSIPFVAHFSGAREKLSFQQFGPNTSTAHVAFVSRFRETELSPLRDYFSLSVKNRNSFAGGIELSGSGESWEFVVHQADGWGNTLKNNTRGFIRSKADHLQIDIVGIRELEGTSKLMTQMDVYGYEFQLDGKVIGAVSTVNSGKVWIRDNIHPELKLVLASVSSGLILRYNMKEARDDLELGL